MLANEYPPEDGATLEPGPKAGFALEATGLAAVTLLAAGLRIYRLDQNGTGNPYYGACVRSMLASASNFFFGSFDPAGIVTVDKPPVALWVQGLSAKLLGYGGISVLLPQALMGVASVVLVWYLVRRAFGAGAGLLSALALAVTPICVAIDRDNLPDTALVLALLLATWAITRAAESGKSGPLMLAMGLVGLAFNIKMLAAFVVLPTFVLAYWLAAPVGWKARVARLAASGMVLVAASLSWSIAVELTPKDRRPYIGGSRNNSALELALGYNGIARIAGMGGFGPGGMGGRPPGMAGPSAAAPKSADSEPVAKDEAKKGEPAVAGAEAEGFPPFPPGGPGMGPPGFPPFPPGGPPGFGPGGPGRGPGGMPGFGGTPGFARFANRGMSGLITWLFPLALLGSAVAATRSRPSWPIGREHLALTLWVGWFATHWVVFSFAQGIFHEYYTTAMGPAVAAMAGIGAVALWDASRRGGWRALLLPTTILLTAAWQGSIVNPYPDWKRWIWPALFGGVGVGSLGLLASRWLAARWPSVPWMRASAALAGVALLIGPTAWSMTVVLTKGNAMIPTADPTLMGAKREGPAATMPFMFGGAGGGPNPMEPDPAETARLVEFLRANRHGASILIAAQGSMPIAPIIIQSGETAVSLGGFMGGDPAVSKDQFIKMVEDGKLRFYLVGGGPGGGPPGGPGGGPPGGGPPGFGPPGGGPPGGPRMGNPEIMAWVREHGQVVDSKLWKGDEPKEPETPEPESGPGDVMPSPARMMARMLRMTQVYDLKPELGLVPAVTR